jgi:hypothetical protein
MAVMPAIGYGSYSNSGATKDTALVTANKTRIQLTVFTRKNSAYTNVSISYRALGEAGDVTGVSFNCRPTQHSKRHLS